LNEGWKKFKKSSDAVTIAIVLESAHLPAAEVGHPVEAPSIDIAQLTKRMVQGEEVTYHEF
jgi:hypothetical protein